MDKVDRLYECYEILANAGDKVKEHEDEYRAILQAVKGETQEKMLASQFIPRFFTDFPHLNNEALDAQLDLIEDLDVQIRKQALKHLPMFCKVPHLLSKVADVLAQMLMSDDSSELAIINSSMVTVLKLDVKEALKGLFDQIKSTEEKIVRKRAVNFICTKIKFLPEDMITKEIEEYILQETKEAAKSLSTEDFSSMMALLANFRAAKTLQGQQSLIEIIMGQVDLEKDFNYENAEETSSLLHCIRSALPFFNYYVSSGPFVKYICHQILHVLKNLASIDNEIDVSLEVLKLFAEISPFFNEKEHDDSCLEKIYATLIEYVPLPPAESLEDTSLVKEPNLQLSHIECMIYALHQLAKKSPDFFISEKNAARFKEFKIRLNFLARNVQGGSKRIKESLNDTKTKRTKEEEEKLTVALRSMENIHSLIKDLFHSPPSFKTTVVLSWKPSTAKRSDATTVSLKRKASYTDENTDEKKKDWKNTRQLYTPPSGKYSGNVKFYSPRPSYFRGRGRGRYY